MYKPLANIKVLTLALNIPGPLVAKRLQELGASVIKVEPPQGDPFQQYCFGWYQEMKAGQELKCIDLKSSEGIDELHSLLANTDLLLTAQRPAALDRLGLDWKNLSTRHPKLNHLAIVGYPHPLQNHAGHDLTYQASLGLIEPPQMPKTLIADLAGAGQAACQALALLMGSLAGQAGQQAFIALSDAAEYMAQPVKWGITTGNGLLGGALPEYALYETQSGWVAIAAIEPHFKKRLKEALELDELSKPALSLKMKQRSADEWARWANELDIPLLKLKI